MGFRRVEVRGAALFGGILADVLEANGFSVRRGVAEMETAFIGEIGSGKPVVAFLGEFDALAGMSQAAGLAKAQPLDVDGTGHGCGHNLLGVGSLMAAIALAQHLKENGLSRHRALLWLPRRRGWFRQDLHGARRPFR